MRPALGPRAIQSRELRLELQLVLQLVADALHAECELGHHRQPRERAQIVRAPAGDEATAGQQPAGQLNLAATGRWSVTAMIQEDSQQPGQADVVRNPVSGSGADNV